MTETEKRREAEAPEQISKVVLVLGITAHLLSLPTSPSLRVVHHGPAVPAPRPGWAPSPQGFVRASLSPFCGSHHLEVLSSPLAYTPNLHTGASVLASRLALSVPSNCHLQSLPLLYNLCLCPSPCQPCPKPISPSSCFPLPGFSNLGVDIAKASALGILLVLPGRTKVDLARGQRQHIQSTDDPVRTEHSPSAWPAIHPVFIASRRPTLNCLSVLRTFLVIPY